MLIYEFSERTGYFPTTEKEWEQINAEYMAMPENVFKDEFCQQWVNKHLDKVKKQQEITAEIFQQTFLQVKKINEGKKWFNEELHTQLHINVFYECSYIKILLHYMQLKSFGFTF